MKKTTYIIIALLALTVVIQFVFFAILKSTEHTPERVSDIDYEPTSTQSETTTMPAISVTDSLGDRPIVVMVNMPPSAHVSPDSCSVLGRTVNTDSLSISSCKQNIQVIFAYDIR